MAITALGAKALSSAVGGLLGSLGGIFGGGARRREQRAAQKEFEQNMTRYETLDLSNTFKDLENFSEDLRVSTQAADFQAQQAQQGMANTLDALRGVGGGTGIAALAQSLAQQQGKSMQGIAANIDAQERQNEMMQMQEATRNQQLERQGEQMAQQRELDRRSTLLGMSQQRLAAANQARAQATKALTGGLGQMLGGVAAFGGTQGWFDKGLPSIPNQNLFFDVGNPVTGLGKFDLKQGLEAYNNRKKPATLEWGTGSFELDE